MSTNEKSPIMDTDELINFIGGPEQSSNTGFGAFLLICLFAIASIIFYCLFFKQFTKDLDEEEKKWEEMEEYKIRLSKSLDAEDESRGPDESTEINSSENSAKAKVKESPSNWETHSSCKEITIKEQAQLDALDKHSELQTEDGDDDDDEDEDEGFELARHHESDVSSHASSIDIQTHHLNGHLPSHVRKN